MWFRNLLVYRLSTAFQTTAEALEEALKEKLARPCASQELSTFGFIPPLGKGDEAPLVHASGDYLLIAARKEQRILPSSVVREALKEKVEQIEEEQQRKVYKKERDQLKDEIILDLLPRAFVKKSSIFAAIDLKAGLIFVDSSSHKKAEDLLSTIREVLGSLPVRPLNVKIAPSATMTDWVKAQQAQGEFYILDRAVLVDTHEEGGKIAATRQDLSSDEIQNHLTAGKLVTQLSLSWSDKLAFTIDDQLVIKSLRFEDLLQDQAAQDGGDDHLAQLDASFHLMMGTFADFMPALIEAFGGEEIAEGI